MIRRPKVVALYLPQYHPIPENDAWWEPGFTEWTNVTKALPLYPGHEQPCLPGELGFYDLRVPETRQAQANLAREHGVDAFCYYHYWFGNGRRLLERPFQEVLTSKRPDFPFMLCWANQTWSGIWHGMDKRILVEQSYLGAEDDLRHFLALLPAFQDSRYVRVDDKPVFMVYAPDDLPDALAFTERWQQLARDHGLPGLYLIAEHGNADWPARRLGFDAFVLKPYFMRRRDWVPWTQPATKLRNKLMDAFGRPSVFDYEQAMQYFLPDSAPADAIPCVLPNWDNTPRSGARGVVLANSSPEGFGRALDRAMTLHRARGDRDNLIFIKSWNEWAEGNHLEPCRQHGRAYLETLQQRLQGCIQSTA
jgi:lipopolysaccharide biosynthesis protein